MLHVSGAAASFSLQFLRRIVHSKVPVTPSCYQELNAVLSEQSGSSDGAFGARHLSDDSVVEPSVDYAGVSLLGDHIHLVFVQLAL